MSADKSKEKSIRLIVAGPPRIGSVAESYRTTIPAAAAAAGIRIENLTVIYPPEWTEEELVEADVQATDLLILNCQLPTTAWRRLPSLQRIAKLGRLRRGVDQAAVEAAGLTYTQLADPSYISVAEHTLLLMLASARRFDDARLWPGKPTEDGWPESITTSQDQRRANWKQLNPDNFKLLWGSRLGIIGLGEIGAEITLRAQALGMEVIYHNRRPLDRELEAELGASWATKQELLSASSFIVVAATVDTNDQPIVSAEGLETVKHGAVVINISRGGALEEDAVIAQTAAGRLGGLGLDVFAVEPVEPKRFHGLANSYLTAHVAAVIPAGTRFAGYLQHLATRLEPSGRGRVS